MGAWNKIGSQIFTFELVKMSYRKSNLGLEMLRNVPNSWNGWRPLLTQYPSFSTLISINGLQKYIFYRQQTQGKEKQIEGNSSVYIVNIEYLKLTTELRV